jgi:hypothetical protein
MLGKGSGRIGGWRDCGADGTSGFSRPFLLLAGGFLGLAGEAGVSAAGAGVDRGEAQ